MEVYAHLAGNQAWNIICRAEWTRELKAWFQGILNKIIYVL